MLDSPLTLATVLVGLTAAGFWLERTFRWAAYLGSSLLIILLGAAVSNGGLVAPRSPVYDVVTGPVTSLAIVWLLLSFDLRELKTAGPRMLVAFGVAVMATTVGAVSATLLLAAPFGEESWKLAGVLTGTYSGGSLNFVAVGRGLVLPEALFAAATAADNVVTALWMGATLVLPLWLAAFFPTGPRPADGEGVEPSTRHRYSSPAELGPSDLAWLGAVGLVLVWAADRIGAWLSAVPDVIWLTSLTLVVAQLPPVRRLRGAPQLGLFALNLFFAVIGIGSRIGEVLRVGPHVFYLTALTVALHAVLLFGVARLLRLDVETTAVASQAAIGGPSTALALAAARGWTHLAVPGVVAGLLGYAAGNYLGFLVAYLVRGVLG